VGEDKTVTIPNGVTRISDVAFAPWVDADDYDYVESIIIPSSVTSIGDEAFIYLQ